MAKSQPVTLTIAKAFGLFGKLLRTTEEEGVTMAHWQKPIDDIRARRNLAEYLKADCPKLSATNVSAQSTLDENQARTILANDYISVEEVEKAYPSFQYTEAQRDHLAQTLPTDAETLEAIKADNCILLPAPPMKLTLLGVRDLENDLFFSKTGGWYADEKFARTDKITAGGWIIIRKTPIEDSLSKNWKEQQALITSGNRIPNAAEMSYAVTAYYKVRDKYLLGNANVRTSSVDDAGGHVIVGNFDGVGLRVSFYWDDRRRSLVGVAAARQLYFHKQNTFNESVLFNFCFV